MLLTIKEEFEVSVSKFVGFCEKILSDLWTHGFLPILWAGR